MSNPGTTRNQNYSIVIDIGTTTIFGQLLNLNECVVVGLPGRTDATASTLFALAEASDYNGQISYGEDVITRIVYSQKPGGLKKLQEVVVSTINGIIHELLKMSRIDRSLISHLVIAGNTTMTQLLLGLDPKYIREEPLCPHRQLHPAGEGGPPRDRYRRTCPHLYLSRWWPVMWAEILWREFSGSGIFQRETLTLYMDIGTNGEIVLGNKDWLASDSCSAGPAFEGAGIKFGMRATRGAIEEVSINHRTYEPMILTIGRAKPIGICGSGLIDAVAELLETGMIDQNGKFRSRSSRPIGSERVRMAMSTSWHGKRRPRSTRTSSSPRSTSKT